MSTLEEIIQYNKINKVCSMQRLPSTVRHHNSDDDINEVPAYYFAIDLCIGIKLCTYFLYGGREENYSQI